MHRAERKAFTLIEVLVVIAIIVLIAAIVFPVFGQVKASAKRTHCISNLRQIGLSLGLYMADHDDVFPHAVDTVDKNRPEIWSSSPQFQARIAAMPYLHEALQPYADNRDIFNCPADTGTQALESNPGIDFPTQPSLYRTYGSSYFFRTEIAFRFFAQSSFKLPSDVNVLFDAAGHWHGSARAMRLDDDFPDAIGLLRRYRYNVLFGDFRAKSVTYDELQEAWDIDL